MFTGILNAGTDSPVHWTTSRLMGERIVMGNRSSVPRSEKVLNSKCTLFGSNKSSIWRTHFVCVSYTFVWFQSVFKVLWTAIHKHEYARDEMHLIPKSIGSHIPIPHWGIIACISQIGPSQSQSHLWMPTLRSGLLSALSHHKYSQSHLWVISCRKKLCGM